MLQQFLKAPWLLGILVLTITACADKTTEDPCIATPQAGLLHHEQKVCGMSLTAPRNAFVTDPMQEMGQLGIDWVALLPYGHFDTDDASISFDSTDGPGVWWGESPSGLAACYQSAKAQNMNVMLKPQLWAWELWIGDMDYPTQAEWDRFHDHYTTFILFWARFAEQTGIEMLCIGTEIKQSAMYHPQYWKNLIPQIRQVYSGKLTYAPNWDEYEFITFWDQLDYIGVDAYFPLLPDAEPSVCALKEAWEPTKSKLKAFSQQYNKPMLFTEWGYLSLDGCAFNTWELENDRGSANINEQAQANACQALLETFGSEDWWAGGFQWKWYGDLDLSTRSRADDYTPQGKVAEQILKQLYMP